MISLTKSLLTVFIASLLLADGARAADKNAPPKKGKWIVLFDGKSTAALRGYKMEGLPDCWKVTDGTLQTVATKEAVTDVITKEKFHDFELVCDWRMSPGGNSGIIYRVSEDKTHPWETGPEYQLLDDTKANDGKNPKTSAGSLYAMIAPANKELKPVGEWNTTRIIIKNNHVEHWLNGKKILEYTWGSDELKALIAQSKFKDKPLFATQESGHIDFQHHHHDVWFKNIKICPL